MEHFLLLQKKLKLGGLLLLLLVTVCSTSTISFAQHYATTQTTDKGGVFAAAVVGFNAWAPDLTLVETPGNATNNNRNDHATLRANGLNVTLGFITVGLYGWSSLTLSDFGDVGTVPGGKTTYVKIDLPTTTGISLSLGNLINILNLLSNESILVSSNGGTTNTEFLLGPDGSYYLGVTPTNNYTSVTIRFDYSKLATLGLGTAALNVYHAAYYPDNLDCGKPIFTTLGSSDALASVTVGSLFTNQHRAIDGNPSNYALMGGTGITVGAFEYLSQTIRFGGTASTSDHIALKIALPSALIDLDLLSSVTVQAYNGSNPAGAPRTLSSLLNLDLLILNLGVGNQIPANTIIPYYFHPNAPFDRVTISAASAISATILGGGIRIYDVNVVPTKPAVTQQFVTIHKNQSVGTITATSAGNQVQWYNATNAPIGSAGSGSATFPGTVSFPNAGVFKFHAAAFKSGCTNLSDSTLLTVQVLDLTPATPLDMAEIGTNYALTEPIASSPNRILNFQLASGHSLPSGLSLGSNGIITGAPEDDAINTTFDVVIEDQTGGGNLPVGTFTFTIKVKLVLSAGSFPTTYGNVTSYAETWNAGGQAKGGTGNYTYALYTPPGARIAAMPSGFNFVGNQLVGDPSNATIGNYDFEIEATDTDSPSQSAVGTFSFTIENSLPVKLAAFEVSKEGSIANLNWSTTEEINTDRFEIQRSAEGKNWSRIGSVKASLNSTVLKRYNYTDQTPLAGINYYRLKMIDTDGSSELSEIRSLTLDSQSGISLYPNPASSGFKILASGSQQIKEVVLYAITGQILQRSSAGPGSEINISHLPVGLYTISVTQQNGQISTHKILKQ